jgi:hypothetical protein
MCHGAAQRRLRFIEAAEGSERAAASIFVGGGIRTMPERPHDEIERCLRVAVLQSDRGQVVQSVGVGGESLDDAAVKQFRVAEGSSAVRGERGGGKSLGLCRAADARVPDCHMTHHECVGVIKQERQRHTRPRG